MVKSIRSEFNLTLSMLYVELNEGLRDSKSNDQSEEKLIQRSFAEKWVKKMRLSKGGKPLHKIQNL